MKNVNYKISNIANSLAVYEILNNNVSKYLWKTARTGYATKLLATTSFRNKYTNLFSYNESYATVFLFNNLFMVLSVALLSLRKKLK